MKSGSGRQVWPIVWSLVGAAVVALLIYGLVVQSPSRTLDEALARGEHPRAPEADSRLPALSGTGARTLASYTGKVVVVNFWASWCTPCEHEAPMLEHFQAQLQRHDATVLGVTFEDTTTDSLSFVHRFKLTYPNVRDVSGNFAHAYGTAQLPESFVVDRLGRIETIWRGEITKGFLERALAVAERS